MNAIALSATWSSITSTSGFLPVHKVAQRRTARRTASRTLLLVAAGLIGARRGVGRVGDEVVAVLLDRNAERADQRRAGKLAVVADRQRDRDQPAVADPAALVHGRAVGRQDHVAVEHQPADPHFVDLLRLAGREADDVAILLDDRVRNAVAEREPRLLGQVPRLAVDRNDDLGPDPIVHLDQLGPARMAGDVDMRLALGDDLHAEVGQLVHDPADRDLVAGDDPRREDDRVALAELELVRCPTAIRPSAARGSPCPPVAMISTSLRGSRIASSKPIGGGKSLR